MDNEVEKGKLIGKGMTAEVYEWGVNRVIKLFYPSIPLNWIQYEDRLCKVVSSAGIPAPAVFGIVETEGRCGIVYERVAGRTMLKFINSKPWKTAAYGKMMAQLHGRMHRSDGTGQRLPEQKTKLAEAIRQSDAVLGGRADAICAYMEKLPGGSSICHGDFHPDNILLRGAGESAAVIDWTDAYVGNPLGDVARTSILLSSPFIPPGLPKLLIPALHIVKKVLNRSYLHTYFMQADTSQEKLDDWLLPVAAARLRENLPGERQWLLQLIDARWARAEQSKSI
ncbi:phosphotransferase family protein [Paenibacillus spongiae]|uniref:Aminoglycoside phosphotransferase family protein n=1 Tax=Paenibacillus spongiae TaxID=2909671 RepID=A0ABY5S6H0_9BACL|nr:aminoglycoside phosphotransferase family protein [Paenibacillus spongiae]UVI29506.1 aminoglycoside phosphotransferase family protein [Paenibacillus spongiae]